MEAGQTAGTLALMGAVLVLNPDAAIGAVFGSVFFMLNQNQHSPLHRAAYGAFSMVAGYALGQGYGDPWSMFAAICGAAGSVVVLSTALERVQSNEASPLVSFLLDWLRGRK